MTRVLVLGASGMLGHKVAQVMQSRYETWATFRGGAEVTRDVLNHANLVEGFDPLDDLALDDLLRRAEIDWVINAVGLIKQRPEASDPASMIILNSVLPHRIAAITRKRGVHMVHVSTDCVFSGSRGNYTEDDVADATDLYGRSKLLGEVTADHALTMRTSVIGRELKRRSGLLEWFLTANGQVPGFVNAFFSGMTTLALARVIADVVGMKVHPTGLWHVSSERISKFELLSAVKRAYGLATGLVPDPQVRIDRSLKSDGFWRQLDASPPTWDRMLGELSADPTPYRRIVANA